MELRRTSGRRSAGASKLARRGFPSGSLPRLGASQRIGKASARLLSGRQRKQSGARVAAVADVARGLIDQGSARGSKKVPPALAMAAAGAVGGVVLARRRKAGTATEPERV